MDIPGRVLLFTRELDPKESVAALQAAVKALCEGEGAPEVHVIEPGVAGLLVDDPWDVTEQRLLAAGWDFREAAWEA